MKLLFTSLVRPHLKFANVWAPRFLTDKNLIEAVQRRATGMIPELKNLTYEDSLKNINLPSSEYRRKQGDMIEVYKYLHEIYKIKDNILLLDISGIDTRGH